jgi:hypothetical protein
MLSAEAADLLDPEAYAEIAPFSADEGTRYDEYWDRLREVRAALEEMRDGLPKTFLPSTEHLEAARALRGRPSVRAAGARCTGLVLR